MKFFAWPVCLFFASAYAQQESYDLSQISESFSVRAATVEVVVTDAEGDRVSNLPVSAFSLLVDGKSVPITHFEEHINDRTVMSGDSTVPSQHDQSVEVQAPPQPVNLLLFIDDWLTSPTWRNHVFQSLPQTIRQLKPHHAMTIVRFDGERNHLICDWTSDQKQLLEALAKLEADKSTQSKFINSFKGTHSTMGNAKAASNNIGEALGEACDSVLHGAGQAVRAIVPPKGRRILMTATTGWVVRRRKFMTDDLFVAMRPLTDAANQLGYTVYPLQFNQMPAPDNTRRYSTANSTMVIGPNSFELTHANLKVLAEETGGKVISKAHLLDDAIGEVTSDAHTYYTLIFDSGHLPVGERHNIEVRVAGDYLLRYRKNIQLHTLEQQRELMAEAALLSGADEGGLVAHLGKPQKESRKYSILPFKLDIPLDYLIFSPTEKGHQASLELLISSEDKSGNRADMVKTPVVFTGRPNSEGQVGTYEASMRVRNRPQRFVFSLHDIVGGSTWRYTVDFEPPRRTARK